jgi:ribonuclease VapC
MIAIDTSAIVAVVFSEPERDAFRTVIRRAGRVLISTVSAVEAKMVVHSRRVQRAVALVLFKGSDFGHTDIPVAQ